MANRVDTPIEAVQPSTPNPARYRALVEASGMELLDRDDPMLAGGYSGEDRVRRVDFLSHTESKSPRPLNSPPWDVSRANGAGGVGGAAGSGRGLARRGIWARAGPRI